MKSSSHSLVERYRRGASVVFAALFIGGAVFVRPPGFDTGWREVLEHTGGLLLIVAALGRIWSFSYVGGRKNRELCREGPYSVMRNPLYFFSFVGICGVGLALQSLLLTVFAAVVFLTYYHFVIRVEDARLPGIFGPEFTEYCRETPRFWPRLNGLSHGSSFAIPPKLFLRNLTEVFWFLAAILVIEWIEWAKLQSLWPTMSIRW